MDEEEAAEEPLSCRSALNGFKTFSATIWVVVAIVVLVNALITVIYSCFVDPLHESFALTEYDADLVLSMSALAVISMQFPASWIMDYFGGAAYWIWLYSTTLTIGMGLLSITAFLTVHGLHVDGMRIYGMYTQSVSGLSGHVLSI